MKTEFNKHFINYLAILVILLTFIYDYLLLFVHYPSENRDLVNLVAGVLNSSCLAAIISFFYGSSKSSQDKMQTITELTKDPSSEQK